MLKTRVIPCLNVKDGRPARPERLREDGQNKRNDATGGMPGC
jgi:hypothetical protein